MSRKKPDHDCREFGYMRGLDVACLICERLLPVDTTPPTNPGDSR